jgi:membrane-associated phospholipid phosphatase
MRAGAIRARHVAVPALAAAITVAIWASSARADDAPPPGPLRWDPAFSHAGPLDYGLTIFSLEDLAVYLPLVQDKQPPLHWTSPILFDKAVRDLLRGSTPGARSMAELTSWIGFGLVAGYPAVDVAYAYARYGSRVAWDLFWQDATVISLSTMVDLNIRDFVGRARPPVYACIANGGSTSACLGTSSESTRSFPGGHVAIVTAAAAVSCTQHLSLHIFGSPWDELTCGALVVGSMAVGTLRIVSDDHWASDILVGSTMGFLIGWGVPYAMHFHRSSPDSAEPQAFVAPTPMALSHGGGLGLMGWF